MTASRPAGVSILASMASATMEKSAPSQPKAALTPLATEGRGASILTGVAPAPGLPPTPAMFPNDHPQDELLNTITVLETQRDALTAIITALRLVAGDPETAKADYAKAKEVTAKLIEREADRKIAEGAPTVAAAVLDAAAARDRKRAAVLGSLVEANKPDGGESFADRQTRLAREAQEATYAAKVAVTKDDAIAIGDDGWKCPVHGTAVTKISARRGREYQACGEGCGQYQAL